MTPHSAPELGAVNLPWPSLIWKAVLELSTFESTLDLVRSVLKALESGAEYLLGFPPHPPVMTSPFLHHTTTTNSAATMLPGNMPLLNFQK